MKTTNTTYHCDKCKTEMTEYEYENISPRVTIRVDLPNPKGGCGEVAAIEVKLCAECADEIGINNTQYYHETIHSSSRIKKAIENFKDKILKLLV